MTTTSPCSPAGRSTFALTTNCATPQLSVLRTHARRVLRPHVAQDAADAVQQPLDLALDHFSMFDRVTSLDRENAELRAKVQELSGQLGTALERAATAEASAAAAALQSSASAPGGTDTSGAASDSNLDTPVEQLSKEQLVQKVHALERELVECQAARRKAHDQWVESRGAVRVMCRLKPIQGSEAAVHALPDGSSVKVMCYGQESRFLFGRVYPPTTSTAEVYSEVDDLVQSSMDGYHVCLMSYGQTGSGKTYSMLGGRGGEARGIIPRALDKILSQAQRMRLQGWAYVLEASCMELYGNSIRDLLAGAEDNSISDINAIKHDPEGGTTVTGVSRHALESADQAVALISRAMASRVSASTACNAQSSRSHCVFSLHIKATHAGQQTQLAGALCLVDLAGSERLERSQAQGVRQTETAHINSSLSSLGDVFEALSQKRPHVPYRNSKLTYLLKPGGKTLFMVHVNPEPPSAYESLTSLRFATKVSGTELGQASKRLTTQGMPVPQADPTTSLSGPAAPSSSAAVGQGTLGSREAHRARGKRTAANSGRGAAAMGSGAAQSQPASTRTMPAGPASSRQPAIRTQREQCSSAAGPGTAGAPVTASVPSAAPVLGGGSGSGHETRAVEPAGKLFHASWEPLASQPEATVTAAPVQGHPWVQGAGPTYPWPEAQHTAASVGGMRDILSSTLQNDSAGLAPDPVKSRAAACREGAMQACVAQPVEALRDVAALAASLVTADVPGVSVAEGTVAHALPLSGRPVQPAVPGTAVWATADTQTSSTWPAPAATAPATTTGAADRERPHPAAGDPLPAATTAVTSQSRTGLPTLSAATAAVTAAGPGVGHGVVGGLTGATGGLPLASNSGPMSSVFESVAEEVEEVGECLDLRAALRRKRQQQAAQQGVANNKRAKTAWH